MEDFIPNIDTTGGVGLLIDHSPVLTVSHIKPYVIAILLHRGAVRLCEVATCLISHAAEIDIKDSGWDPIEEEWCEGTRMEKLINEVLGEMTSQGLLRYNELEDLWVLSSDDISQVISWVSCLGGKMPDHVLSDLSRKQLNRIPEYLL